LAIRLTGANANDITQLLALLDAVPPVRGKVGRPRRRPEQVQGDRAYDSNRHRQQVRARGIQPSLARRRVPHGSGLGVTRWVVDRTVAWFHQFKRLRIRYTCPTAGAGERRDELHEALFTLGCDLICWRAVKKSFC
jgi:transposase